jgi:hypothetical protein
MIKTHGLKLMKNTKVIRYKGNHFNWLILASLRTKKLSLQRSRQTLQLNLLAKIHRILLIMFNHKKKPKRSFKKAKAGHFMG